MFINCNVPIVLVEGVFDAIAIRNNAIPLLGKFPSKTLVKRLVDANILFGDANNYIDDKGNFKSNDVGRLVKLFKDENTPMNGLISEAELGKVEPLTLQRDPFKVSEDKDIPFMRQQTVQEYFGTKFGGQIPSNAVSRFGSLILNDDSYKQKYDFVFQKNTNTTPKEKIDRLRGLDTEHKKWAKDLMLLEFSELRALINQRDSYADYRGKNPEMLFAPTEQEKEDARQQNQRALSSLGLQ